MIKARAHSPSEEATDVRLAETGADAVSDVPVPLTSFIGREIEITDILSRLDDEKTRLLTLIGPGGVGKTRLALEAARRVAGDFADGARFLSLTSLQAPDQVLPEAARAYEVHDRNSWRLLDLLVDELRPRHTLLVLDNFEHLLAEPPMWLVELLGRCPRLKVLVTSRVPLNVTAEHRFLVPPMAIPEDRDVRAIEPSAVTLFALRAQSVRPDFALTAENVPSVTEICRRLDGLPLAIELAAARISVMTPKEIHAHLTARSRLIAGGQRDAPLRLRSMRDAIAWGHDLLDPGLQQAFRELAVFPGGFTLEAAEAVVGASPQDADAAVAALVDASFLQVTYGTGPDTRYFMLETIQEFGLEQLAASGDEPAVRDRHGDWCVAFTRSGGRVDPIQGTEYFDRLEAERASLVAAMAWLDETGRLDDLAHLIVDTRWLWYMSGREGEGLAWFERVIARYQEMDDTTRCDMMCWAGHLAQMVERPDATAYLQPALDLARAVDDTHRQAVVTLMLGIMAEDRGDYADGEAHFRSAGDLFRRAGSDWSQHTVDYHLGVVTYGSGNLALAEALLESSSAAAARSGDPLMPIWIRNFLTLIACERGKLQHAMHLLAQQPVDLATGHRHDLPAYLGTVGVVASARGQHDLTARLLGAAERSGTTNKLPERAAFERVAGQARRQLGDEVYTEQFELGRRMRREQVEAEITQLLAGRDGAAPSPAGAPVPLDTGLTRREQDVLALLAEGQTNREIADALYLSQRTVANHVDHILSKLGARSRTAAVAFAIRNGLA